MKKRPLSLNIDRISHIDISAHKNILDQTKVEIKEEQKESEVAQAEAPEDTGGDAW